MNKSLKTNNPLHELIELEKDTRDFGFNWPNQKAIIAQAISECHEITEAIQQNESSHRIQEEIGDLIHAAISLCIFSGYDAEETLANVVKKLSDRMQTVKKLVKQEGLADLKGQSFEYMLEFWNKAKL